MTWIQPTPQTALPVPGFFAGDDSARHRPPADDGQASRPRERTGAFRVLMVDDEELIRRMAAGMARRIQIDLVTVGTAAEAMDVARTSNIDVLIADVLLGEGLDGIDLARQIGAMTPGLSVILMSGYTPSHFEMAGLPEGTQFLMKPFNSDSLARSIALAREHTAPR